MSGRVWDPYLSESDRQWLDARPERPQRLGSSPALLMIDLYRGGFGDAPQPLAESVKRWPWSCGMNAWNALPAIVQLLAAARRARIPVIHSTMRSSADGLAGLIEKTAPSAFAFTPLLAHLRDLGVDTVLVAGMATSGCVRATVVDGVAHRYRMVVAEPCVFDRLDASHALSLLDINQKYGDVVGLDDAVSYLRKVSG